MPKHVPTFKHLLHTSTTPSQATKKERSVNDLLASSRQNRERDRAARSERERPPHLWLPDTGDGLLPAERLRLSEQSRRAAARSVAGPAPPRSWQRPALPSSPSTSIATARPTHPASTADLISSSALLSRRPPPRPAIGPPKLLDACLSVVLHYIEDETVVRYDGGQTDDTDGESFVLGQAILEQAAYLDNHLIEGLLSAVSILPEGARRLSDRSLRTLLASTTGDPVDDWDAPAPTSLTNLSHLPLTLHPAPASIMRDMHSFPLVALTSLNLSFSTIADLERLAAVLPPGLRELALVGNRSRGDVERWTRGLKLLGRRLIVLRTLDLSDSPFELTGTGLAALLHPVEARLPSLRLLGLRGNVPPDHGAVTDRSPSDKQAAASWADPAGNVREAAVRETRRALEGVVRSGRRWVEIVWDD
ncbi:hypothetical protein Q5752_001947 [Cryptotrichosporon argae]